MNTPICISRYPTLPRGLRLCDKGRIKSNRANTERWRRNEYEVRLAQLASHPRSRTQGLHAQLIIEVNCLCIVIGEVLRKSLSIFKAGDHALPQIVYDCHHRRQFFLEYTPGLRYLDFCCNTVLCGMDP